MPWLNFDQGRTPAELSAGYQVHGGSLPSGLLQRHNPYLEAIKAIAPGVKAFLDKKKNDDIANQLQNIINPPRAEALDPSMYDPSLAASQGLDYQSNFSGVPTGDSPNALGRDYPGPPATQPFRGGASGMKVHDLYQSYLDQEQGDAVKAAGEERKARLDEANIARLNRPDDPRQVVPTSVGGQTLDLTPDKAADFYTHTHKQPKADSFEQLDKDVYSTTGAHIGDFATGRNPRIENDQFKVDIQNPDGTKKTVPLAATLYQKYLNRFNTLQGGGADSLPAPDASPPPTGSAPTLKDSPVQVQSVEEANALPAGTYFLTPDGRLKRKP